MQNLNQIQFEEIQLEKVYVVIFGYSPSLGETGLTKCTGKEILERVAMEVEEEVPSDDSQLSVWAKNFITEFESEGIDYCLIYEY